MNEISKEKVRSAIEALMRHPTAYFGDAEAQEVAGWLSELLALRERAEPVAYISKADLDAGYPHILARKEYSKACPMAVYTAPPAPVVPEEIAAALIAAIEKEQDRLFGQDYLMDSKDCIDVIREEMERLKVCRGAMLAAPGKEG